MPLDAEHDTADDVLLMRVASGDAAAARVLTLRLGPRAFAQAARLLSDRAEAEDVTQEALLRLWKIAPNWRQGEAQVSTWLYRVVANLCTDRHRKAKYVAPGGLDAAPEVADDRPRAEARLHTEARRKALRQALDALPERQRMAVELRHIEGLANPEIADLMNIGVEAVESLTARGKRKLAALLAEQREELRLDP